MQKLLVGALCALFLLAGTPAGAHGTYGYDWWPSIAQERRVEMVRKTHKFAASHSQAHWMLLLFDCESQMRWWIRGTYWGTPQADENFRNAYSPPWEDGWLFKEQVITTRRGYAARGGDPWPNCPNEQRGQR